MSTKKITDFVIPVEICEKAKDYMKGLLKSIKDNHITITSLDNGALMLIAYTYHDYMEAMETLANSKKVIKETNARNTVITKAHPAVKMKLDAQVQLQKLLAEFHLTPRSRNRNPKGNGMPEDPIQALLYPGKIEQRS